MRGETVAGVGESSFSPENDVTELGDSRLRGGTEEVEVAVPVVVLI